MIKAIIFDCFGVVVADALEGIINELGLPTEERDQILQLVIAANRGEIAPEVYRTAVANKLGITESEYVDKIKSGEVKNEPLLDYIQSLKPHYKIGLLSNVSSLESLESRFAEGELKKYFDVVVASSQIGYAKPEAQAYEITASQLDVRLTECIMIDDRQDYCQGAIGTGMQAIQYESLEQLKADLNKLVEQRV